MGPIRQLNRLEPKLPAHAMKTYSIVAPVESHFKKATCAEVGCQNYERGWKTEVDERSTLGQKQAQYIRSESGRHYTETRGENGVTTFTFEAGQRCFTVHQKRIDRPELYVVRDGDWRGNPRRTDVTIHKDASSWTDDFKTHQQRLADQIQKG